jgi:hypothetical protein
MKNKFYIVLIILMASCSQQNPIEKAFQTKSDEFWCYYTQRDNYFTYFKFKENKLSYRYNRDSDHFVEASEYPYTKPIPKKWSVSQDSIMIWNGFFYDVVSYNENSIVLLSTSDKNPYHSYIFLIKEKERDSKKFLNDFEEKKTYNPEKYNLDKQLKKAK